MHADGNEHDNEHDPLDQWLNQQVRPLSPPPGTFEMIKTRARRRKLRKLAVTVVSAAAVAAAVAIAVPNVTALHLTPSSTSGSSVADGGAPKTNAGAQPDGTATRVIQPVKTASRPAAIPEPSGPVPANFQPSSVTFDSPDTGWVIGQAGTAGHCANANPDICTSIARTDNAGQTWQGGPAPSTTGASGPAGVSGIRFLDGTNGWAFGPELWATHDGGRTWTAIGTHGQRVTDLETVAGRAYALFATCTGTRSVSFAFNCTSFTLMTTTASSDDWVPVGGSTNGLTGGRPASAELVLSGSDGYLLAPDGALYSGPIGGPWLPTGTAPCTPGMPQASGLPSNGLLALVSSTQLAIVCAGTAVTSPPQISTSGNGGKSWTKSTASGGIASFGAITSLAAAPDGTLVLATTRGLYVLPDGASYWRTADHIAGSGMPAGGFSYVGMTSDTQGVAVPAHGELHEIWMTFDGGATWAPAAAIAPGN